MNTHSTMFFLNVSEAFPSHTSVVVMDAFLMIVNLVTTAAFLYSLFTGRTYQLFKSDESTTEKKADDVEHLERMSTVEEGKEMSNFCHESHIVVEFNDLMESK